MAVLKDGKRRLQRVAAIPEGQGNDDLNQEPWTLQPDEMGNLSDDDDGAEGGGGGPWGNDFGTVTTSGPSITTNGKYGDGCEWSDHAGNRYEFRWPENVSPERKCELEELAKGYLFDPNNENAGQALQSQLTAWTFLGSDQSIVPESTRSGH